MTFHDLKSIFMYNRSEMHIRHYTTCTIIYTHNSVQYVMMLERLSIMPILKFKILPTLYIYIYMHIFKANISR